MRPSQIPIFVAGFFLFAFGVILFYFAFLGYSSHSAVCALRADLVQRNHASHRFLDLTVAERVQAYGRALGHIPPATIRNQIRQQDRTIKSLDSAHCDTTFGGVIP